MTEQKDNIITIDGPAGSGKSTIAHALAKKMHWMHVNTGAIYRTFAFFVDIMDPAVKPRDDNATRLQNDEGMSPLSLELIENVTEKIGSKYKQDDVNHQIFMGEENITEVIHTPRISQLASVYAQNPIVREKLLPIQRKIISEYPGVVVDGRDMGTVVFPNAPLKIFLTANVKTRAQRRCLELQERGLHVNFDTILAEMQERDLRDSTRNIAPSKPAADAIIIDSSEHSIEEIVDKIFLLFCNLQKLGIKNT